MKKIALAGASGRALSMFVRPFVAEFADTFELVGVYDVNPGRSAYLRDQAAPSLEVFEDFDAMLEQTKPDIVLVTTLDRFHDMYIIRSLEFGCDVISEKPMTVDAARCRAILAAEKSSGRKLTVTFNYRYMPFATRIKRALRDGAVGKPLSVHFEWLLDTRHGADYFRRWHRRMDNTGGLLVHKATHHFDLVNWFLEQKPTQVSANGRLAFYGRNGPFRGERCLDCVHAGECSFYWDLEADPFAKAFYRDQEHHDGYHRDGCVFAEEIDIYDTMNVLVRYADDTQMTYSLTAHSPYEGYRLAINGTAGRLEAEDIHTSIGVYAGQPIQRLRLYSAGGELQDIQMPAAKGAHGGGDVLLRRMLADPDLADPLGHRAGSMDGAYSILVGIAANQSILEQRMIAIEDLLRP